MTNGDHAKLIVWLDTSGFDEFGLRTLNSGCAYDDIFVSFTLDICCSCFQSITEHSLVNAIEIT